jgi:predicted nucleic acid-binding protein
LISGDPAQHERRFGGDEARAGSCCPQLARRPGGGALCLSCVTLAELLFGIGALPDGRRKTNLRTVLDGVTAVFEPRILPFDAQAA